jgi:plasmid replication initiation protein
MLLKSWDGLSSVTVNLDELHQKLDVPESLRKKFPDFRRRVLERAYEDINATTSLSFEWEPIKSGRTIIAIRFLFQTVSRIGQKSQKTTKEELIELQAKSNKCYEKLGRVGKECVPRPRSKTCKYCQERGRMHGKALVAQYKI